jgi:hypothetical protein
MSSPGMTDIIDRMDRYQRKYKFSKEFLQENYKLFFILYPFLVFFALLYYRPKIILNKKTLKDNTDDQLNILKFCIWFLLLQTPLIIIYYL